MSNFDFTKLMDRIADELGYTLFLDFGTLDARNNPYRKMRKNEIVTPISGVFRLNATPLTALRTPFIAVVTATLDIPAPTAMAEEVRADLNGLASRLNATAEKYMQGETSYTVSYNAETCLISSKRKDVPMFDGEIIPITQVITFTIVESGVSAFDVALKIDGIDVPILTLTETRTAASETTPNASARGEVTISQELYGVTVTTAACENELGDLIGEIVSDGNGNKAHAVEVIRSGVSKVYLMTVGTSGTTVQPPNNVGYNLSMSEISAQSARFTGRWNEREAEGAYITLTRVFSDGVVFWGDGTADRVDGDQISHAYLDGREIHTLRTMTYRSISRWGKITVRDSLRGKRIRPVGGSVESSELPEIILTMDSGDTLGIVDGHITMTVDGREYIVDSLSRPGGFALSRAFTSLLRGTVSEVNTDRLEYDRWAVDWED